MERRTRQHQAIFEVMASAQRPLLAQEIWEQASSQVPQLSVATVYRQLKSLQDEGVIKPVLLPGQNPRYELASHAHHHHFQCRSCERVFDLNACPGNLDRLAPAGFRVDDHDLILYGHCSDCLSPHSRPGV